VKPIKLFTCGIDANIVMIGEPGKHLPYINIKIGNQTAFVADKDLWRLERMIKHCRTKPRKSHDTK
jgi:hypothetical protein